MQIEIGKTYRDGRGRTHTILGNARPYTDPDRIEPTFFYSNSAYWYDCFGRFIWLDPTDASRFILTDTIRNLVIEEPPCNPN